MPCALASGPYQLRVKNPARLAAPVLRGLTNCWQHSYQAMANRFNPAAPALVTLQVVEQLGHPGETFEATIRIDAGWLRNHPNDHDVMTHEQFHVVQNYGPGAVARLGMDRFLSSKAAFFRWLEEHRRRTFPEELDAALRQRSYNAHFWQTHFGKPVEHLWSEYSAEI